MTNVVMQKVHDVKSYDTKTIFAEDFLQQCQLRSRLGHYCYENLDVNE